MDEAKFRNKRHDNLIAIFNLILDLDEDRKDNGRNQRMQTKEYVPIKRCCVVKGQLF